MIKLRTFEEIIKSMVGYMRTTKMGYEADYKIGTVIREIMIDPPAFEMSLAYHTLREIQKSQSIVYAEEMSEEDLDNLVANWFLSRKPGVKATGEAAFYITAKPQGSDFLIPAGTRVMKPAAEGTQNIYFITKRTAYLRVKDRYAQDSSAAEARDGYFDVDLGAYAVPVEIEAEDYGTLGNVAAGTIIDVASGSFTTGLSVVNKALTSGGTEKETNKELAARQRQALKGISYGTKDGYESRIKQSVVEVKDVLTVGPGHEKMIRDSGYGGKADFYILARPFDTEEREEIISKVITTDSSFGADVVLSNQPVTSIVAVELLINGVSVPSSQGGPTFLSAAQMFDDAYDPTTAAYGDYTLVKDTGKYAGSIYAQDKIRFFSPIGLRSNESLGVIYEVNNTIISCQNYLEVSKILTDDVLAKESKERQFRIGCTIDVYEGFDVLDIKNNIMSALIDSFSNTKQGALIQQSDVISIIREDEGTDNVIVPLDKFMFIEDEIVPLVDTQIEFRAVNNEDIVFNHQPVFALTGVYYLKSDGTLDRKLKKTGDVDVKISEVILTNGVNNDLKTTLTATSDLFQLPTNSQNEFYLSRGRLRNRDGKDTVSFILSDITVEGTSATLIDVISEVSVDLGSGTQVLSKILFDVAPTSAELVGGLRVSYYYDNGYDADYQLVKDTGENAGTFNAEDKINWLTEYDPTTMSQSIINDTFNRPIKIYYSYIRMNMGDKQLDVNEFASIKSSQINITVRNVNPLPLDKFITGNQSLGTTSTGDLFDI